LPQKVSVSIEIKIAMATSNLKLLGDCVEIAKNLVFILRLVLDRSGKRNAYSLDIPKAESLF
jgi:hypothetical protein